MGAKCEICEKDMMKAKGCLHRDYDIDGEIFQAIPHHSYFGDSSRCGDCNCKEGEPHHIGCDQEECPSCGLQFISCDCNVSETMSIYPRGRKKE